MAQQMAANWVANLVVCWVGQLVEPKAVLMAEYWAASKGADLVADLVAD